MSTIVTRAGKGSPLTNNEVDANFTNLNTDKVEAVTSSDGSIAVTSLGTTRDIVVNSAGSTTNLITQIRNATGATLTKGTVVYISGATGQIPTVSKALATSDATSAQTLGMVSADIVNNTNGYVTIVGLITNIDTSAYTDGQQLYLSGTTAGTYTTTKPYAPIHLVYVGVVEYAHATQGKIFVKVQNGYELDEIHNVSAQTPSNGQSIVFNTTNSLWENNTISLTAGVNGVLPVANGGTGLTSLTAGYIPFGNGTSAFGSSANLFWDSVNTRLGVGASNAGSTLLVATPDGAATSNAGGSNAIRMRSTATAGVGIGPSILFEGKTGNTTATYGFAGIQGFKASATANDYSGAMAFYTQSSGGTTLLTEKMRLDATGNLGLGVTPSAWASTAKALDFTYPSLAMDTAGQAVLGFNAYNSSGTTWNYKTADEAALFTITNTGSFTWRQAAIGTAGAAVSFTQAMTLDASGNLGIGTTSPTYKLDVQGTTAVDARVYATDASTGKAKIYLRGGATNFSYETDASNATTYLFDNTNGVLASRYFAGASGYWQWFTVGSERMRLDNAGNLGIGTTNPSAFGKLAVAGNVVPTVTNSYTLGTSTYAWSNIYATAITVGGYAVVDQSDIGSGPNEIPLNQYLGSMAYQNANSVVSIGLGAGTAALPSLYSATNISSGLWFPATNTIAFSTNGAEKMRLDANGNLGIGTSSPISNVKITAVGGGVHAQAIVANGTADSYADLAGLMMYYAGGVGTIRAYSNISGTGSTSIAFMTAGVEAGRFDPSGNLGIGTTSPLTKLHVAGTNTGSTFVGGIFSNEGLTAGSTVRLNFLTGEDGTVGRTRAIIEALSPAANDGALAFWTRSAGTASEKMRLDASGNLGIGTNSPSSRLTVAGGYVTLTGTSNNHNIAQGTGWVWSSDGTATGTIRGGIYGNADGSLSLFGGPTVTTQLRLDSSGNLGLGVTPSNLYTPGKVIQVGVAGGSTLYGSSTTSILGLNTNIDATGAITYATTSTASYYKQAGGIHQWFNAPSGTAGNAISFTQAMMLDSSGNLGIGITPSAWGSAYRAIQSRVGGFALSNDATSNNQMRLSSNAYNNGTNWIYYGTSTATSYEQRVGEHRWFNAPNGTAGNAITFTQAMTLDASGNLLVGTTATAAAKVTIVSTTNPALTLPNIAEIATVSATAATGTINYDLTTQSVLYYTTSASANWTLNVRGNSTTTLNSMMAIGQSITLVFLNTNGATAYYASAFTIDGTAVTPKWQGGTAPTAGNASATDIYSYTIIKTAASTYTVFASQTKFA